MSLIPPGSHRGGRPAVAARVEDGTAALIREYAVLLPR